jgi:glycosyltransferase involved in cell wall biosynthesis
MDVSMLTYHTDDFFLPMLQEAGVAYHCIPRDTIGQRVRALRRELRGGSQDVVLTFLDASNLYAELAALPFRRWGLVVSERLAVPNSHRVRSRWRRALHLCADYVTTNSHTNRLMVERSLPLLSGRIATIYNAVDLESFRPAPPGTRLAGRLNLVGAASHQRKKNLVGLIDAVAIVRRKLPALDISVDWYGAVLSGRDGRPDDSAYNEAVERIGRHDLRDRVRLHPASRSLVEAYRRADAVVLPSFFEGLPNVICEAMACGRPVLMSNVCDAGNLVTSGLNGFVFDPASSEDMARAILEFAALSVSEREVLGYNGRARAEWMFAPERFAEHYARLLEAAAARHRIAPTHWVPEVPATAHLAVR